MVYRVSSMYNHERNIIILLAVAFVIEITGLVVINVLATDDTNASEYMTGILVTITFDSNFSFYLLQASPILRQVFTYASKTACRVGHGPTGSQSQFLRL